MRFSRMLCHFPDYFKILNVENDATDEEIKAAYLTEAKRWHPDTNKASDAQARFQLIGEAYDNIKNAKSRDAYRFETSPDAAEDWTNKGRRNSKYERSQRSHHDVQYEYNQAGKSNIPSIFHEKIKSFNREN